MDIKALVEQGMEIGMLQHQEEVSALCMFLVGLQPTNVMEIGSWKGGLFYVLCNLVPREGLKVSVDLNAYGDLDGTIEERNETMRGWAPNVHVVIGNSHDPATSTRVRNVLAGNKLDFLLVDGDHSHEGSKLDYETYKDLVRHGGWIAFHDINDTQFHKEGGCMVSKTWNEIKGHKHVFSVNEKWGGIGLLRT